MSDSKINFFINNMKSNFQPLRGTPTTLFVVSL